MATTGGGGTGYWPRVSGKALCQNQITATFTWQGATPDDVPPQSAIVVENSSASYNLAGSANSQSCADEFGDAAGGPNSSSQTSSGVRYTVKSNPGASFNVTCTPDVNVAGPGYPVYGYATVSVNYNAAVIPVTIGVVGTTRDNVNNADAVLIGQQLTATLSAGGFTQSKWQWTASGDIFKDYLVTDGNNTGNAVELTGADKMNSGFVYYYRSIAGTGPVPSTITCSATLLLPDGTMPTVTAAKTVQVYAPTGTSFSELHGSMDVYFTAPNQRLEAYSSALGRGIMWNAHTMTPPLFTVSGNQGFWAVVQLVTPVIIADGVTIVPPGTTGLDTTFPYAGHAFAADGKTGSDGDTPGMGLAALSSSAEFDASFKTYMLYKPPNVQGCLTTRVPLWEMDWNMSGQALDLIGVWKPFLCMGITETKNTPTATLPSWTRVVTAPH